MSTRTEIAQKYVEAQRSHDAKDIDAFASALADDAVLVTRRGTVEGKAAIVERLRNPMPAVGGPGAGGGLRWRMVRFLARRRRRAGGEGGGGAGMLAQIQFDAPVEQDNGVSMKGKLPSNPMFSSITLTFTFDDQDRVQRIEQHMA